MHQVASAVIPTRTQLGIVSTKQIAIHAEAPKATFRIRASGEVIEREQATQSVLLLLSKLPLRRRQGKGVSRAIP